MRGAVMIWSGVGAAVVVGAAASWPVLGQQRAERAEPEAPTQALVQMYGRESAIRHRAFVVVRDQTEMDQVWAAHRGDNVERSAQGWVQGPQVDFDRCMVVAVFNAERTNCNGEKMESVEDKGDHLLVRYDTISFQTASFDGEDPGETATPWGMFLVPRADKAVVIEENTQGLIGGDPEWTERARIGFPHAKNGWFMPGARGEHAR